MESEDQTTRHEVRIGLGDEFIQGVEDGMWRVAVEKRVYIKDSEDCAKGVRKCIKRC